MNTIYTNGQIITVNDKQPNAEAVVVEEGIIQFVGSNGEALKLKTNHKIVDLEGKTMTPGFIDGHGHFITAAILAEVVEVAAPPVGTVESIDDIVEVLKEEIVKRDLQPGETIVARSYDDVLLKEKRKLNKDDLDRISTEHGVLVAHQSMHVGVGNSFLLDKYGITLGAKDPQGGVYGRYPGTEEPNGELEENAFLNCFITELGTPEPTDIPRLLKAANKLYASNGITTAQEGALIGMTFEAAKQVDKANLLDIDVVGYYRIHNLDDFNIIEDNKSYFEYNKNFRLGGAKFVLDGSPQAKTAWLSEPYYIVPEGKSKDYSGYPMFEDKFVTDVFKESIKRDLQILTHCNGDQASQQLIECYDQAKKALHHTKDLRPVMIHAQTVREDQLDCMADMNIIPSFFQDHTYFWGDWHLDSVLGPVRGARISPQQSAIKRGIPYTIHQDTPVVPPNMIFSLWAAINRKTRSGRSIGEDQAVDPLQALKSITINSAYQHFEEDTKGSITVGKRADLVILDNNPLTVDKESIRDIKVLETIKDGKTVYIRNNDQ